MHPPEREWVEGYNRMLGIVLYQIAYQNYDVIVVDNGLEEKIKECVEGKAIRGARITWKK